MTTQTENESIKASIADLQIELERRAKLELQSKIQVATNLEMWDAFLSLRKQLQQARGDERSERARRLANTITLLESALSVFKTMVLDNLE